MAVHGVDRGGGGGGLSDGDYGDVTVGSSGTSIQIDADTITATELAANAVTTAKILDANVTLAKQANLANATVIGRNTAGTGVPEAVTMAQLQALLNTANGVTYTFLKKTATTTGITSATPANVTIGNGAGGNFELPVTNGHYYKFRVTAIVQSDTATVGVGLGLTTPTFTKFSSIAHTVVAADGSGGGYQGTINSSGDIVVCTAVPVANQDFTFIIDGIIIPSASGNLTLQQQNETGTNNVQVGQGTVMELWDFGV